MDQAAEMPCPQCGYDLRGQLVHRCPECGAAFDPANLPPPRDRLRRTSLPLLLLIYGIGLALPAWLVSVHGSRLPAAQKLLLWLVGISGPLILADPHGTWGLEWHAAASAVVWIAWTAWITAGAHWRRLRPGSHALFVVAMAGLGLAILSISV